MLSFACEIATLGHIEEEKREGEDVTSYTEGGTHIGGCSSPSDVIPLYNINIQLGSV